jgi:hypothetical protein
MSSLIDSPNSTLMPPMAGVFPSADSEQRRDNNLQRLIGIYYSDTPARKAPAIIWKKRHIEFGSLLRCLREYGVACPEDIDIRSPMDALLRLYEVIEIASVAGYIGPTDDSNFWRETRMILQNPEIRKYYVNYWPLPLPQLLLLRLQGRHHAAADDDSLLPLFSQFLELDRRFMGTLYDGPLLRMLDSFKIDGYTFGDVVKLVGVRNEMVRRYRLPPEQRDVRDDAIHDFSNFMRFCGDLVDLLDQLEPQPLLQAEIWYRYSYWFGAIGSQVSEGLRAALDQLLTQDTDVPADKAVDEIERYVIECKTVLRKLTTSAYGHALNEVLEKVTT